MKFYLCKSPPFAFIAVIVLTFLLVVIVTVQSATSDTSSSNIGVQFPVHFREDFLHYATVERPDGKIRNIFINPQAIEAIRKQRRVPDGTIIVIEGHNIAFNSVDDMLGDEKGNLVMGEPFEMIHVLQKNANWRERDFVSKHRMGDWNFGSFEATTGEQFNEPLSACFNCHRAAQSSEFLYSERLLYRYAETGKTVYFFCNLPDRIAC